MSLKNKHEKSAREIFADLEKQPDASPFTKQERKDMNEKALLYTQKQIRNNRQKVSSKVFKLRTNT